MRHRYAGAVHQHHIPDEKQGSTERSREQVAPVFSLPPPPSSHQRVRTSTTAAQRQSLQELPCVSQPSRRPVRSGDPLPLASYGTSRRPSRQGGESSAGQQDPWAPDGSRQPPLLQSEREAVFPSCHCSFSEQEASLSQNRPHPADPLPEQPSPPFPPRIPPPPTSSSSSLLFSRGSERGNRLRRSANNHQQANTVERCRGGGGAGGHQDHRQLLQQQQQHCHLGLQQRDPSPEGSRANSQKGRSLDACESNEAEKAFQCQTPDLQQQQIPQLRAQQQLLVGSSLPVNYCASGSGELCRTHRDPLLQQQLLQQQQHCDKDRNKCGRITAEGGQAQPHSRGSRVTPPAPPPPPPPHTYAGNSSATGSHSSKDSPNYGSSYHLWPESPHKGEERIRIDLHKEANDDLDETLLDQSVEDSLNPESPFACQAMNSILDFYLSTVLPTAVAGVTEETTELKPHVESIQQIFDELKSDVTRCRNYFSCKKQFDIKILSSTYTQMQNKGMFKAMGELNVLVNYIEMYLASKRHRNL